MLLLDAFKKFLGGFVGRVLGDEATLESTTLGGRPSSNLNWSRVEV